MSHSVAAGLWAAHLRTALSRPESTALAAVEALGWVAGWEEPDLGGYMGMKAAAGQWAVYWYPGGRPKEKQGKRGSLPFSVTPRGTLGQWFPPLEAATILHTNLIAFPWVSLGLGAITQNCSSE